MTFRLRRRVLLVFRHRTFTVFFLILAAARSAIAAVHKDPATNTVHIYYDDGGQIDSYLSKFKALRMSGQRVVIDGICASACTIFAWRHSVQSYLRYAKRRVGRPFRLEPDAYRSASQSARHSISMVPLSRRLRQWISRHGGLRPEMIYLRWPEVATLLPVCR